MTAFLEWCLSDFWRFAGVTVWLCVLVQGGWATVAAFAQLVGRRP